MADKEDGNEPGKTSPDESSREEGENKSYRDILLNSLKSKSGESSAGKWVEQLANDTQQALGHQATLKLPANFRDMYMQESVTTWVDKLFDFFLEYAYDFNPAVVGTGLELSWQRPVLFNETVKESKWRDASTKSWHFKGTVSTREWSLIVRGSKEKIYAFIVPNDMLIAASSPTISFNAYLEMSGTFERGAVRWTIDGNEMPYERIHEVAQDLFGGLIRVARGEQREDEKSHLHASAKKAPPPVPHQSLTGKYKVMPSASVDQSESMKISFSPNYVPKDNDLLRDSTSFKLPPKTAPEEKKQGAEAVSAKASTPEKAKEEPEKQNMAMPPAEPAGGSESPPPVQKKREDIVVGKASTKVPEKTPDKATDEAPDEAPEKAPEKAPVASKVTPSEGDKGGVDLMVDGKEINVSQACDLLVGVIDRDLEVLAKAGADAFTNRDMKAAEEALKRSATLNAFRDQIADMLGNLKEQL